MGWNNLIFGPNKVYIISKAYAKIVNTIDNFSNSNPPTNIITNDTIPTQYSINQGLKVSVNKGESVVQK